MNPTISVIICTYNRAKYIGQAIESVLAQSYKDLEILVIDDASTDNTKEAVNSYIEKDQRVKNFLNELNLGISKNRNKGVSLAQGKYIAMLDSDDYWTDSRKLEKQIELLEKDPAYGLVGTAIVCVNENGNQIKKDYFETEDNKIRQTILARNQFAQSSILFRKDIFNLAGGYNENLKVVEDFDLWLRMGLKCQFANLGEVMTAYRIHTGSISKNRAIDMAQTMDTIIENNKSNYPNYSKAKIKSLLRRIKSHI